MPEQVADFFEGGGAGELVDVVAAVGEDAAIAVEVTDGGRRRDDVLEPALRLVPGQPTLRPASGGDRCRRTAAPPRAGPYRGTRSGRGRGRAPCRRCRWRARRTPW